MSEEQLYTLFRLIEKVTYKPEELIFEQGSQPSHIYIVKYGKVKLIATKDDTPFELIAFEQGQCFGESSVIGIQPHAATAIVVFKVAINTNNVPFSLHSLLPPRPWCPFRRQSPYPHPYRLFYTVRLWLLRLAPRQV